MQRVAQWWIPNGGNFLRKGSLSLAGPAAWDRISLWQKPWVQKSVLSERERAGQPKEPSRTIPREDGTRRCPYLAEHVWASVSVAGPDSWAPPQKVPQIMEPLCSGGMCPHQDLGL